MSNCSLSMYIYINMCIYVLYIICTCILYVHIHIFMQTYTNIHTHIYIGFPSVSAVKNLPAMQETRERKACIPTSVFLPGESPWTEEAVGLQFMGSQSWA